MLSRQSKLPDPARSSFWLHNNNFEDEVRPLTDIRMARYDDGRRVKDTDPFSHSAFWTLTERDISETDERIVGEVERVIRSLMRRQVLDQRNLHACCRRIIRCNNA